MHSIIALIFLLIFAATVSTVSGLRSKEFCSGYCLDASRCLHYNCYYSWTAMHCFPSEADARAASIRHSTYTLGFSVCINVGGRTVTDEDGYTFWSDLTNGVFGYAAFKYDISGARIRGASANDQHLYRSGREGVIIKYGINIVGQYEDLQVRLFFAELAYRQRDKRNMEIKFNGAIVRVNMDIIKDAGFSTKHIVYFPIKRAARDIMVYEQRTRYPRFVPLLVIRNLRTSWGIPLWAHLSGICIHKMIDCTKLCHNPNACNAQSKCIFDWKTNHCLSVTQVTSDKECEKLTSGYVGVDVCIACVQAQFCSYDPITGKCHSVTSQTSSGDYTTVKACQSDPSFHNNNPGRCRESGFVYCCETQTCVHSQANCPDTGCTSFCHDPKNCEENGCLITANNECIDCSRWQGDATTCRDKGCTFCCDTNQCLPHDTASCPGGCSSSCFDPGGCTDSKCSYNPETNQCQDCTTFNGNYLACKKSGCAYCCETATCEPTISANCMGNCTKNCFDGDKCELDGCVYDKETGNCIDCTKFDGDANACKESGCDFCCIDHTCKTSTVGKCDNNRCSGNCFKSSECIEAGCQYNNVTNGCFECGEFDHDPQTCRANNCKFCCESDLCELNCVGNCQPGCVSNCFNRKKCMAEGCGYVKETGQCVDCAPFKTPEECTKQCAYCCDTGACQAEGPNCIRSPKAPYAKGIVISAYEHINFEGAFTELTGFDWCPDCRNLPKKLKNQISGMKVGGLCFYIFDEDDCDFNKDKELICTDQPDFTVVAEGGWKKNDKINSMMLYDGNSEELLNKECAKLVANAANDFGACTACVGRPTCTYDPQTKKCVFKGASNAPKGHEQYAQCRDDPSLSNRNPINCRERGYEYCCDTQTCETAADAVNCKGNKGCAKHCFDMKKCEDEGCLYTVNNECKDCATHNGDQVGCKSNGCSYCCDTSTCRAHADADCMGGCSQNCHNPDECNNAKCIYDQATGACQDCSTLNGKVLECRAAGCEFCCETSTCHGTRPAQCNSKCVEHCGDQTTCEMNDCLYSPFSGDCFDCSPFQNDAVACRMNGCDYCCNSQSCHAHVPDSCPGGCSQMCFQPKDCLREDCFYNPDTNRCEDCSAFDGDEKECRLNECNYCCNTETCHRTPPDTCKTKCVNCKKHNNDPRACLEDGCAYCCEKGTCQVMETADCVRAPSEDFNWAKHVTLSLYNQKNYKGQVLNFNDFDICPGCRAVPEKTRGTIQSITFAKTCFQLYARKNCSGITVQLCYDREDMDVVRTTKGKRFARHTRSVKILKPATHSL